MNKLLFGRESRNAQADAGARLYGGFFNSPDRESVPDSGRVVDQTGKTLVTYFSKDHLARWIVSQGIGSGTEFDAKGLKIVGNDAKNAFDKSKAQDLFEKYAGQFSEDEMMEGDNWTPQKISSWLRSHGVSDQSEINFVIGVFRSELGGY